MCPSFNSLVNNETLLGFHSSLWQKCGQNMVCLCRWTNDDHIEGGHQPHKINFTNKVNDSANLGDNILLVEIKF